MTIIKHVLAAGLVSLPGLVVAQGAPTMNSTFTLGYSNSTADIFGDSLELGTTTFDIDTSFMFGANFGLDIGLGYSNWDASINSSPTIASVDLIGLSIEPIYYFGNGAYAGLYYRTGDLDVSITGLPITFGVDTVNSGLFGGYATDMYGVEVFYGTSDTDPSISSLTSVDITDLGISGSYRVAPNAEIFGTYIQTKIDDGTDDLTLSLYSLGGQYDMAGGFSVFGSYGGLNVGGSIASGVDISATQIAFGGSYDLSNAGMGIPAIVSLEFARTSLNLDTLLDTDIDTIGLGITFPIGAGASRTPQNASTSVSHGEYRSAISGTLAALR